MRKDGNGRVMKGWLGWMGREEWKGFEGMDRKAGMELEGRDGKGGMGRQEWKGRDEK